MIPYERLTPAVDRAAGIASSSFPAHHDISDVKQELWLWIMENKNTVTRVLQEEKGEAIIVPYLVRAAHTYLKKEDAASYCYPEEDQFNYSVDLIKSLLEVVFEHQDWISFATQLDDQPKGKSNPAHGNEQLAMYADVKSAAELLPEDQYNALVWRYKYKYTYEAVGAEFGITKEGGRQLLNRAISGIQQHLGKRELDELRRPPQTAVRPGTAASRARIERDYEG